MLERVQLKVKLSSALPSASTNVNHSRRSGYLRGSCAPPLSSSSSSQRLSNLVPLFFFLSLPCAAAEYLQTIQATSVLACVFAILALFVFVAQLFTLPKGQRFTFTGILQLIACK